ncbi:tripartite motif-containing protein 45-like [Scleropages formosus]|uniref:RING-type E3 ubiquitin transferase n=1 Tax=Scleropages formosus TaxID=113540 RepID=A0A0P7WFE9_SCLFO|nr:tripartite motif-containing protein 45-like [Scleropages formosus]
MSQSRARSPSSEPDATSDPGCEPSGAEPCALCPVCAQRFRDPRILPCLHSVCADCARRLEPFRDPAPAPGPNAGSVSVLCPQCDAQVELPPGGVEELPPDHLALDRVFLESLSLGWDDGPGSEPGAGLRLACDLCGEGGAQYRCQVCSTNLCTFCSQAHRRQKRTSAHSVELLLDLRAQGRLSRPTLCPLHPGLRLQLYCEPCDAAMCGECSSTAHRGHRCIPAHDAADRHAQHIHRLLEDIRPRLAHLEGALRLVESSQNALRARADEVAQEVRAFARDYAVAVEQHCGALLQRLEDVCLHRRNLLHLQRAQLRQTLADVRGGADFAERLLTAGFDPPPVAADSSTIYFLPQESAGQVGGFPMVGVIQAKVVDPSKCVLQGEGAQRGREGQQGHFTLLCRDTTGEPMGRGGDAVLVSIVHRDRRDCTAEATVVDNGDGSYRVSYTPSEPGLYSVWVCVRAQHIKGSPFVLAVNRKFQKHHGVFHCCSFCSSGGAKEARCACGGSMPGGYQGCGHSHPGHPGRAYWSCCGSTVEISECVSGVGSACGIIRTVAL